MKRNVWIYGLILGTILAINMVLMVNLMYRNPGFKGNEILGYAAMVVVFSLTFFGIRNFRNKQLNGVISFGKAFKTGALIALVGSTIYVVVWLFYYYLFVPDFMDVYSEHMLNAATNEGASTSELSAKSEQIEQFKKMYSNPLFVILITYSEVFPVGLIVALISALILKRKNPAPASTL